MAFPLRSLVLAAAMAAAVPATGGSPKASTPDLRTARVVDLPHSFDSGAWIGALPMKIAGGSGEPLRAIALVPVP